MEQPEPEAPARPRERPRPRVTASETRRSRAFTARIIAASLTTLACLALGLYGFHALERFLIIDPRFALNGEDATAETGSVEVSGASHASARAVQGLFAEDQGRSVYLIPLSERRGALRTVDWVKDATVARVWPNRVMVTISERMPVAFLTLQGSTHGGARFGLIDEDGVILPPAKDRFNLPVLTGVRALDSVTERRDRVHRMLRVMQEVGEMGREISEVDVSDRDDIKVAQPYHGRVLTLLLGDHNFRVRYRNFVNHYSDIQKRLPGATTLDLRLEDRITVVE